MNKRDSFAGTDFRDVRSGSYDAINDAGRPQPDQVHEAITPHEAAQDGADVRPEPMPSQEEILPEGLRRPPMGPYSSKTGRRAT
ncbi:hypothetical protein [Bradyrhizobium sp. STM 3562]|uniref:hypothetical protein n=1 Tax=Bradyrhizobium sp. STM 3562 TaxID=578924 RepID=UPI00388D5935